MFKECISPTGLKDRICPSECNSHTWHKVEINFYKGHSTNAENSELQAHRTDLTNTEENWSLVKCQAVYSSAPLSILGGGKKTPTHMQAWKTRVEIIIIVIVKSLQ